MRWLRSFTPRVRPWPAVLCFAAIHAVAACADDGTFASAGSQGSSTSGESDGSSAGGGEFVACDLALSPWTTDGCLAELQARCSEMDSKESCDGLSWWFSGVDVELSCRWARSARVTDIGTCAALPVREECVATVTPGDVGCYDACLETGSLYNAFTVMGDVVYHVPCGPNGKAFGMVDPGADRLCAANIEPPAPPVCECAPGIFCP